MTIFKMIFKNPILIRGDLNSLMFILFKSLLIIVTMLSPLIAYVIIPKNLNSGELENYKNSQNSVSVNENGVKDGEKKIMSATSKNGDAQKFVTLNGKESYDKSDEKKPKDKNEDTKNAPKNSISDNTKQQKLSVKNTDKQQDQDKKNADGKNTSLVDHRKSLKTDDLRIKFGLNEAQQIPTKDISNPNNSSYGSKETNKTKYAKTQNVSKTPDTEAKVQVVDAKNNANDIMNISNTTREVEMNSTDSDDSSSENISNNVVIDPYITQSINKLYVPIPQYVLTNTNSENSKLRDVIQKSDYIFMIFHNIKNEDVSVLSALIDIVGDTEIKNDVSGDTPLIYALKLGKIDSVKVLLAKGASINAKDYDNRTAMEIAKEKNYDAIMDTMKLLSYKH